MERNSTGVLGGTALRFREKNSDGTALTQNMLNSYWTTATAGVEVGYFSLNQYNSGALTEPFVIKGGKVGIGTTSPSDLLSLNGSSQNITIDNDAETDSGLIIWDAQDHTQKAEILYGSGTNQLQLENNGYWTFVSDASGNVYLSATGNSLSTADLFINNSLGYVGIGTTTPQNTLNVNGDANATGTIYAQSTKNLSIGYDYATNGSLDTLEEDPKWTGNWTNFTAIYGNQVTNASVYGYAINDSLWTLNYSNFTALYVSHQTNFTERFNFTNASNYQILASDAMGNITADSGTLFVDAVSNNVGI